MERLYRLTAFPKGNPGGNKAGVYLNADYLDEKDMQIIAKKVGYSETAFVMKSENADFKVRFFTPESEVDLCGHATIATFNLMRDLKIIDTGFVTQETKAGILRLEIREKEVFMEQPVPVFSEIVPFEEINDCFNFLASHNKLKPQIVSTGIREIFLPVDSKETLGKMVPDFKRIERLSKKYNTIGIHAFALSDDVDAYGRNFAPVVGINEESATGTSNGALSCYLFKNFKQKDSYILRQGYTMGLPSEIKTVIIHEKGLIKQVWVGGTARVISE